MALKVTGSVLSVETEPWEFRSRKTGQQETMDVSTIILQGDYGILAGTVWNPKTDMSAIKVGQKITVELREYKNERPIQKAVFRM